MLRWILRGKIKGRGGGGGHGGRGRGGDGDGRGSGGSGYATHCAPIPCDDRFYNREAYTKLLHDNRVYLRQQRDARKKRKTNEGTPIPRMASNPEDGAVGRQLSVLASAVGALQVSAAVETPAPAVAAVNSTNPSL